MKKILITALSFLTASVFAAHFTPNQFVCHADGVDLSYTTTNFSGQPLFHLGERNFVGDQIRTERTSLGNLVTVQTEAAPDAYTITASLLVPGVNMRNNEKEEFDTILIETTHRSSIGGPSLVKGALESYRVKPIHCEASFVVS